ncbi:MAG: PTS sugar transporter subunit IIA [Aestuariivirgaceae bacterium]|nr:PTS sugar transporter subunit IIA [Aestuariivirgaceae bacterium]
MLASGIETLIPSGAVLIGANCKTADEVIRALSAVLYACGNVKQSHAGATLAREATHPTGLPTEGLFCVAIPHTDPEHVLKPGIAIATLPEPVSFKNMEDLDECLPVRLVFMLAFTDKDKQIEALQMVAGMLQSPDILSAIVSATTAGDILDIIKGQGQA